MNDEMPNVMDNEDLDDLWNSPASVDRGRLGLVVGG